MAKEDKILTIDIGGDNLKMAEFHFGPGGLITLTGFAFRHFEPGNTDEEAPGFLQVYHEMLAENNFTAKGVRLSISAQSSFQRLSKLPPMLGSRSAISRVVEYEARQAVPYAMSEIEWGYQLIHHEWEETRVEPTEDGGTTEVVEPHEEYEALFVAVKNEEITAYTDVIEDSGKEILSVEIAPIALYNAAKAARQIPEDGCSMMLNIGGRSTSLVISDRNRVFMRSIPIAGDTVTQQIAKEFGIGFEEAESLKLRHGFVALGGAYDDPESELAATISKIARNVMTRLHGEISRSINVWRSQHGGSQPASVLLSGGGSTMMYVTDFFQEKLRVPVAYLNTFSTIAIAPEVNKEMLQQVAPMFQELIGQSLRSVTECPIDISLIPRLIRNQRELDRKKPFLYASSVVAVLCLIIFSIGVSKLLDFDRRRVERVKVEVGKTNRKMSEVNALMSSCNSAKGQYEEAMDLLSKRNLWFDMLDELQKLIPDTMWLIRLEGVGDQQEAVSSFDAAAEGEDPNRGGKVANPFNLSDIVVAGQGDAEGGVQREVTIKRPDLREVKRIRLVGYTVEIAGLERLEAELEAKLANSKYFNPEWKLGESSRSRNLSRFEIFLTLKEPIKK